MSLSDTTLLESLLSAASPFLRIVDVKRGHWCRVMQDPKDGRIGPWKYTAEHVVLDQSVWKRPGEVIYFVTDAAKRLRLVGQSMSKLNGRWKTVPMYDVQSSLPLGRKALFHTTSWPAIEAGFMSGERPPFVVSALFREQLEALCRASSGGLAAALLKPQTHHQRLSFHVETWVCSLDFRPYRLWNKQKISADV